LAALSRHWDTLRTIADRAMWALRHRQPAEPVQQSAIAIKSDPIPAVDDLGQVFPEYRPIHPTLSGFIDDAHAAIASLPVRDGLIQTETPGFLRPADALALYELAWFSNADILELGSAWGLSTSILCQAARNAGRGRRVVSVEIDPQFQRLTARTIRRRGLSGGFRLMPGEAATVIRRLIDKHRRFGLVFVDHDHSGPATATVCRALPELMRPGGMALFHDFNDTRHRTEPDAYGVYPAVRTLLEDYRFRYLRTVGCCGLVQRLPA
jgi:predicted O-methyltransferase YrrM